IDVPITLYAERGGKWAMSPGYDNAEHAGFSKVISYRCMFCHNAYPEIGTADDSVAVYPAKLPEGIDCQRCHGPARGHVDAARSGRRSSEIREEMVTPRQVAPVGAVDVC